MKYKQIIAVALAAVMSFSLFGCKKDEVEPDPTPIPISTQAPTETPIITEEPVEVVNDMPDFGGAVLAGENVSYGLASDGTLRFMGKASTGQNLIHDWDGIVQLTTNGNTVAALNSDGSIRIAGASADAFADAERWENVVSIAMGSDHLVGLNVDGTVRAIGDNSEGQCDTSEWVGAVSVAAAGNYTAALTANGSVLITSGQSLATEWSGAMVNAIAAADTHIVGLTAEGTVLQSAIALSSNSALSGAATLPNVSEWTGIVKVFASNGATHGVDSNGKLYTTMKLESTSPEVSALKTDDVLDVAASKDHILVLHGDGTVSAGGNNESLQCTVGNWRLTPYVTEEGYLLGMNVGDTICTANGEVNFATGVEATYVHPVTGVESTVTCVLLGDVNGDGEIDTADHSAAVAHVNGEATLSGAFLRAANVISDSISPDAIDIVDTEEIRKEAEGMGQYSIDQYAVTDEYTDPLSESRRINTDALGYITIPNTNISYPIMYGADWYYHERGIDKQYLTRGSLYYYWSKASQNTVITGHNARTTGTMFHELHNVQNNAETLLDYPNRVWYINSYGISGYWEVWSIYEESVKDISNNAGGESSLHYNTCWPNKMESLTETDIQEWIDYQLVRSEVDIDANVTVNDRFLTLVTCGDSHADSNRGARLYIFLRLVGND